MDQILIYSDSLTWGIIPNSRKRLAYCERWPGVFENSLRTLKKDVKIIENCLNGRRTVWKDPFKEGRNGSIGLAQVIEMNSPIKLVILMLGTNDFQRAHNNDAWQSAQGIARLVGIIKKAPIEPLMLLPEILIVAPPTIIKPKGIIADKFQGAENRIIGLAREYEKVADELEVHFFNSSNVTEASKIDGIHLDLDQHYILGEALANFIYKKSLI